MQVKRLYDRLWKYMQASWFSHFWVSGLFVAFGGIWFPHEFVAWWVLVFFILKELFEGTTHAIKNDYPGWWYDMAGDLAGPVLVYLLAAGII